MKKKIKLWIKDYKLVRNLRKIIKNPSVSIKYYVKIKIVDFGK